MCSDFASDFPSSLIQKSISLKMYLVCKQIKKKARFTFRSWSKLTRNLLPWYRLEKGWDSGTGLLAPQIRLLVPWWAIPFGVHYARRALGHPSKGTLRLEKLGIGRKSWWTAEKAARWEQLSSCADANCLPFPNLHPLPLKSYRQELPHPGFATMTQIQTDQSIGKETVSMKLFWNQDKRQPTGR